LIRIIREAALEVWSNKAKTVPAFFTPTVPDAVFLKNNVIVNTTLFKVIGCA